MKSGIEDVGGGIVRVTFALPLGIDHVHCYLLPASTGGWILVDTGLGTPDAEERWREVLDTAGGRVDRIVITHFHPDHVGAAAVVAELTGAPVHQGRLDYEQCVRAWRRTELVAQSHEQVPGGARGGLAPYFRAHGLPEPEIEALAAERGRLEAWVGFAPDPELLEAGDAVDGWEVLHLPGHADGHLALLRDGVMIAGDALLATISPNVGLYPESRPDPLADYFESLARIERLAPTVAHAGHGPTIRRAAERAAELVEHHDARLGDALRALDAGPATAYDASLALFPEPLSPPLRRFALAETRAHLEHLVGRGAAERRDGGLVTYAAR